MKIAHFVETLDYGGLEKMVLDLSLQQRHDGHDCQIVCVYKTGALARAASSHGIPVVCCDKKSGFDIEAIRRGRDHLKSHGTEVVHTHNAIAHYYAVFASRKTSVNRIVNTRHGMGLNPFSVRREILYRLSMLFTDYGVAVCGSARSEFIRRRIIPRTKARLVPNGIPIDEIATKSELSRIRLLRHLGIPGTPKVIGTVGRLSPVKDQATLIEAFSLVRRQLDDVKLVIIGEGRERERLVRRAKSLGVGSDVLLPGERNDVKGLVGGFDVFVLSSVSEGFSIALLEACAAAVPIVATDVGGNGEIIAHNKTGYLVPSRSPHHLAEAILKAIKDTNTSRALADAARRWVAENASVTAMSQKYYAIYGA